MPAVTDLVNSSVYNAIRSSINNVLGVGDGAQNGYGRTLESVSKADNDVIFAADMQKLFNDLVKTRTHQTGNPPTWSNADGLAVPSIGELVGVYAADVGPGGTSADATADQAEGFADFEAAAQDILTDKDVFDASQFSTTIEDTNTRQSSWNGSINHTVTVTWLNADERRYFFNTGGTIKFDANLTGGTSVPGDVTTTPPATKDEIWQTMLNNMGTYKISVSGSEVVAGTATINSGVSGIYSDTSNATDWSAYNNSNRLTVMSKSGTGVYSENEFKIEAWQTNTNSIRFLLTYSDNDIGDDVDGDEYSNPADENVTGTITAVVTARTATGLGKEYPALTINDEF